MSGRRVALVRGVLAVGAVFLALRALPVSAASARAALSEFRPLGTEFVELVNVSAGVLDLAGWTIRDEPAGGGGLDYTVPAGVTLAPGGRLLLYTAAGDDSGDAALRVVYADAGGDALGDAGGHLFVADDLGEPVDYIAWGSQVPAPPGGDAPWAGPAIEIAGIGAPGSLSLVPSTAAVTIDRDDGSNWHLTTGGNVTPGAPNPLPAEPTVGIGLVYPPGQDYANACQEATAVVTVTRADPELPVYALEVELRLPPDFYYAGDDRGGTYDNSPPDHNALAWTIDLPAGVAEWAAQVTFKGSCEAADLQEIEVQVNSWRRWADDADQAGTAFAISDRVDMRVPVLNVLVEDEANPGSTTILASRGDEIGMLVTARNSGPGALAGGQVLYSFNLQAGLDFISLEETAPEPQAYAPGPEPTPTTYTRDGGLVRWRGRATPGNSDTVFLVRARVVACDGLTADAGFEYGCADFGGDPACEVSGAADSSVTIVLRQPKIEYLVGGSPGPAFPALGIDWCEGTGVTVSFSNTGEGPARSVTLVLEGIPADVTVATPPGPWPPGEGASVVRVGNTATFTLENADDIEGNGIAEDLAPGSSHVFTIEFDLAPGVCDGGVTSGTLLYRPHFLDCCDLEYTSGIGFQPVSTTPIQPSISISKSGDRQFINVGEGTVTWQITVTYTHPTAVPGDPEYTVSADISDIFPNASNTFGGFGNFTLDDASPAGYTIEDSPEGEADMVLWSGVTLESGVPWTGQVVLNAPANTCAGGRTYTNSARVVTDPDPMLDCRGCEVPGSATAAASVTVNNAALEDAITAQSRTVDYEVHPGVNVNTNNVSTTGVAAVERGARVRVVTATLFSEAAPGTWADVLDGRDIEFVDLTTMSAGRGLSFAAPDDTGVLKDDLELVVEYEGVEHTALIDPADVTLGPDGEIRVNLRGLNAIGDGSGPADRPDDAGELRVGLTLLAPAAAVPGLTWSQVIVPVEGGQDCEAGRPEIYDVAANMAVSELALGVSLSAPAVVARAEILETITVNVTNPTPWQPYDVRVDLDPGAGYAYLPGTTSFPVPWRDANGDPVAAFEPDIGPGGVLRWHFGDLDPGDRQPGSIRVTLLKLCNDAAGLNATAHYNTNLDNGDDAGMGPGDARAESAGASYAPVLLTGGSMEVRLSPEIYYATDGYPRFRYYVINRGNGPLFNAWVTVDLGGGLVYRPGESELDGALIAEESHDDHQARFRIPQVPPGETRMLEFNMRLAECADLGVEVNAAWGRDPADPDGDPVLLACQVAPAWNSQVTLSRTELLVNRHTTTPSVLAACGAVTEVVARITNSGLVEVYNVRFEEILLPRGMELVPGSVYYALSGDPGNFLPFPGPGGPGTPTGATFDAFGDLETLLLDFVDPAGVGDESASLITDTDGREGDGDGLRHRVLKPGKHVEVRFQLRGRGDCAAVERFTAGPKQFRGAAAYDSPCTRGAEDAPPNLAGPTNTLSRRTAAPDVTLAVTARNETKGIDYPAGTIYAEAGDLVYFDITLRNEGNWRARDTFFTFAPPAGVTVEVWEKIGVSIPGGMTLDRIGDNWHIDRKADGYNPADTDYDAYLDGAGVLPVAFSTFVPAVDLPDTTDADEYITFRIHARVDGCADILNDFRVTWGCCPGPPPQAGSGTRQASRSIRSDAAPAPTVLLRQPSAAQGGDGRALDVLGGDLQVVIHNPDPHETFTLYDLDLRVDLQTLPAGYEYDDSFLPEVAFSGAGAARAGLEWDPAEREPGTAVSNRLRWASSALGGQVAPAKAVIFPGETITIRWFARNTGEDGYVDDDERTPPGPGDPPPHRNDNDAADPDYVIPVITYRADLDTSNSCGEPRTADHTLALKPVEIDVDIIEMSPSAGLAQTGDVVTWTIRLRNRAAAPHDAPNVFFELDVGAPGAGIGGYTDINFTQNPPSGSPADPYTWDIGTLGAGDTFTIVLEATVGPAGTGDGDLSLRGTLEAETQDQAGNPTGHRYVRDYTRNYVPGVIIDKTFSAVNDPGEIADPQAAANASIGNVVSYDLSVTFLSPGNYAGVSVTDLLDDTGARRLDFVSAELVSATPTAPDVLPATPAPTHDPGTDTVTMLPSGGAFTLESGAATWLFRVRARVRDIAANRGEPPAAGPTLVTNRMDVPFTFDGMSYAPGDHPDILRRDATGLTVIEPLVAEGDFLAQSVSPPCGTLVVENDVIEYDIRFTNTGSGPMHDTVLRHLVPVGKRQTPVFGVAVTVNSGGPGERVLAEGAGADFSAAHGAGDGELVITLHDASGTGNALIGSGETVSVTYSLTVDPGVGADQVLEDRMRLFYTSLPGDGSEPDENGRQRESGFGAAAPGYPLEQLECGHPVEAISPEKRVAAEISEPAGDQVENNAQVGERLTYTAGMTVPAETTVYDLRFSDIVPDGLTVLEASYVISVPPSGPVAVPFAVNPDGTTTVATPADGEPGAIGDLYGGAAGSTLTVTIVARVDEDFAATGDPLAAGDRLDNTAAFTWDLVPGGDPAEYPARTRESNRAETTVREPDLSLFKDSDVPAPGDIVPGQAVQYTVSAGNTGDGVAWNTVVRDILPRELRAGFAGALDSVTVLAAPDRPLAENTGYTLAWDAVTGEILVTLEDIADARVGPGETLEIRYTATAPADLGAGKRGGLAMVNAATVPAYYSLPTAATVPPDDMRREYPEVGPVVVVLTTPEAEITKDAAPAPGTSLEPGGTVVYTLRAPEAPVDAFCHFFTFGDTLPDGLETGVARVTVTALPDPPAPPGLAVSVEPAGPGGRGRVVTVTGDRLEPGQQLVVEIEAEIHGTFEDGTGIPPGHEFENFGFFAWHDDPDRENRLSNSSLRIRHPFLSEGLVFEPDNWAAALPGTVVFHRHFLRNDNQEAETDITFTWPASSAGWEWLLYPGDGDGNPVGAPLSSGGVLSVPGAAHPSGNNRVEIIMRAQVPGQATAFTTDVLAVTAADPSGRTGRVTDTTVVQPARVRVVKEASHDGVVYAPFLEVEPGREVYQRLRFANHGTEDIEGVRLFDVIPAHAEYVAGSATGGADLEVAWSTDGGENYVAVEPVPAAAVTNLRWEYVGNGGRLPPGPEQEAIFRIRIK